MSKNAVYQISLKLLLKKGSETLVLWDRENILDLPGGRIGTRETQKSFPMILAREIREELGKEICYTLGSPVLYFTRHLCDQKEPVFVVIFEAKYLSGNIALSSEHKQYEWIDLSQGTISESNFFSKEEYCLFRLHFSQ